MGIGPVEGVLKRLLETQYGITSDGTTAVIAEPAISGGTIEDVEVSGDLVDATTYIVDNADPTKRIKFELAGQTTGTDRTLTPPDADDTLMGLGSAQTVTGVKTFGDGKLALAGSTSGSATIKAPATAGSDVLTLPSVSGTDTLMALAAAQTVTGAKTFADGTVKLSGSGSGTCTLKAPAAASTYVHTLPAATDTLVGVATADNLLNKTLTSPTLTTPSLGVASATTINKVTITAPATGATITIPDGAVITAPSGTRTLADLDSAQTMTNKTVKADTFRIVDPSDTTKKIAFAVSGISAGQTRTYTVPDADATIVSTDGVQTLSNKTFASTVATGVQAKGAAAGAAGSITSLSVLKTAMANNMFVSVFTVTVPNGTLGAGGILKVVGILGDGDSTVVGEYQVAIARITGSATVAAVNEISTPFPTTGATADASLGVEVTANTGAVDATQTFDIRVRVIRSAGASDNHVSVSDIELSNGMASGVTIAAA